MYRTAKTTLSRWFVCLLVLLLSSGCASFREGQLSPVTHWPLEPLGEGKSVVLMYAGLSGVGVGANTFGLGVASQPTEWQLTLLKKAYQESRLFSAVATNPGSADFFAEVKVVRSGGSGPGMLLAAVLTGLTLYLVPSAATDQFTITTTYKDKANTIIGTVEKTEALTLWQQLFMAFAYPFNRPATVFEEMLYDLHRATITEAQSKGFFK